MIIHAPFLETHESRKFRVTGVRLGNANGSSVNYHDDEKV